MAGSLHDDYLYGDQTVNIVAKNRHIINILVRYLQIFDT